MDQLVVDRVAHDADQGGGEGEDCRSCRILQSFFGLDLGDLGVSKFCSKVDSKEVPRSRHFVCASSSAYLPVGRVGRLRLELGGPWAGSGSARLKLGDALARGQGQAQAQARRRTRPSSSPLKFGDAPRVPADGGRYNS